MWRKLWNLGCWLLMRTSDWSLISSRKAVSNSNAKFADVKNSRECRMFPILVRNSSFSSTSHEMGTRFCTDIVLTSAKTGKYFFSKEKCMILVWSLFRKYVSSCYSVQRKQYEDGCLISEAFSRCLISETCRTGIPKVFRRIHLTVVRYEIANTTVFILNTTGLTTVYQFLSEPKKDLSRELFRNFCPAGFRNWAWSRKCFRL